MNRYENKSNNGYPSNGYSDNMYQNNGYQGNEHQNSMYQGNIYQSNEHQDNMYQNNGYQNNGYQSNGYQGTNYNSYSNNSYKQNYNDYNNNRYDYDYNEDNRWESDNMNMNRSGVLTQINKQRTLSEKIIKSAMVRAYVYMFAVLIISGIAAYTTYASGVCTMIIQNGVFLGLAIAEIAVVFIATRVMNSQNVIASGAMLLIYSIINGMTLSVVFEAYLASSIVSIFFIAALMFGVMAAYGAITKKDLTTIGNIGFMLLIGVIIATTVNVFFIKSTGFDLILSIIGVAVFIGITAYDSQKLKQMARTAGDSEKAINSIAMICALALYLDFINLFLKLLSIFGRRK